MANYETMNQQAANRNSNMHGVNVNNDFTGYGQVEVLENAILLWEKEFKKKASKAEELWFRMEPIAIWINSGEIAWHMIYDGDRLEMLCKLICALFVETFRALHKDKLIHPDSPIKNIGMIAGLAALGKDENCISDRQMKWFDYIVGVCRHGGVEIELAPEEIGEQELIEKYLNKDPAVYTVDDEVQRKDADDNDDILGGYDEIVRPQARDIAFANSSRSKTILTPP
jgi:hypothetical protein